MSKYDDLLNDLATQINNIRQTLASCAGDISSDRSRIEAAENALINQANSLAEIREATDTHRHRIAHNAIQCTNRHTAANEALGAIQKQINAVLESHTAAIFRLETRIDRLAEHTHLQERRDAGTAPVEHDRNLQRLDAELDADPAASDVKDVADADGFHPEAVVDRTEHVIDTAGTHTKRSSGPRPTVPAEQRPVS